jgi:hypothetical protein
MYIHTFYYAAIFFRESENGLGAVSHVEAETEKPSIGVSKSKPSSA